MNEVGENFTLFSQGIHHHIFFSVTLPLKIPERNLSVYSLFPSEPIVEIKVSTPISVVFPRFKVTLNLMACIANHKPFEEGEFPTNALVNIFYLFNNIPSWGLFSIGKSLARVLVS